MLAGGSRAETRQRRAEPARRATVGYLPQEPERRAGETVRAFLARRTGVAAAQAALDAATEALAAGAPAPTTRYAIALERWLALGGADLDERAEAVAAELGLAVALDRPMTALSGGQAARAGLASLLLSRYDVFLLDEPTNDLDLDGLDRLERFVDGPAGRRGRGQPRPRVPGPHRRPGASSSTSPSSRSACYGGGYEAYLAERERARRHAREEYEEYAEHEGRRSRRGPGRSGPGWRRASATRRRKADGQRQERQALPRRDRARSRPPRPARPSG